MAAGRFREDLYYRLNVVTVRTVPLKHRSEDIEVLARYFLARFAIEHGLPRKQLSLPAAEKIRRYDWPGNVRQLENILERAALFSAGDVIGPDAIMTDPSDTDPASHPSVVGFRRRQAGLNALCGSVERRPCGTRNQRRFLAYDG